MLADLALFIKRDSHILSRYPLLLFQQCANEPDGSVPSRLAASAIAAGRHPGAWLRWVNKPKSRDPAVLVLAARGDYWTPTVTWCGFTPNGTQILTLTAAIRVWNAETGALVRTITAHPQAEVAAISPDGSKVATAARHFSASKEVRIWELESGRELARFDHGGATVRSLAFSMDGSLLVSGTDEREVVIRDTTAFREVSRLQTANRPQQCVFAAGRRLLAIAEGGWNETYQATVWEADSGNRVAQLSGHEGDLYDCAFNPDATRLATVSADGALKVWDIRTSKTIWTESAHNGAALACAWSPDGHAIVSGGQDSAVRVWDAASGAARGSFSKHTRGVLSCSFSPDSRRIVSGDGENLAVVWGIDPGQHEHAEALTTQRRPPLARLFSVLQRKPDSERSPAGEGDSHQSNVTGVAFSPDGARVASASYDGTVRLWDASTAAHIATLLPGEKEMLYDCAWSPDGKHLVAASHAGSLVVWDATTGRETFTLRPDSSRKDAMHSCAWSADGRWIAGSAIFTITIWDARKRAPVRTLEFQSGISSCRFSPDSKLLLDSTLQIWDVSTGGRVIALCGRPTPVFRVSYSPNGDRVLATWGNGVCVWNAKTGDVMMTEGGHSDETAGCAWSPDGRWIFSASKDGEVVARAADSGAETGRFIAGAPLGRIAAGTNMVACGHPRGSVILLERVAFPQVR